MAVFIQETADSSFIIFAIDKRVYYTNNKQLLDEAEHDIKNYSDQGQCYLPKRNYTFKREFTFIQRSKSAAGHCLFVFSRAFSFKLLTALGLGHERVQ
jgi:hypothetical protein